MLRVAVVSDTHAPRFWKAMPAAVAEQLTDVDAILHAGDVCVPSVLDELAAFAPVHVVHPLRVRDYGAWLPAIALLWAATTVALLFDVPDGARGPLFIASSVSAGVLIALGSSRNGS